MILQTKGDNEEKTPSSRIQGNASVASINRYKGETPESRSPSIL